MNEFSYTKHILYINDNASFSTSGMGHSSRNNERHLVSNNERRRNEKTADIAAYFGLEDTDLEPFIITRGNAEQATSSEKSDGAVSANGFIRWDALCHLFNKHFIPINDKDGLPIFVLTCTQLINEDLPINESEVRAGKHMSPILMAKVNNPLADRIIGPSDALDNSLDPTVCLAPHQHPGALDNERSKKLMGMFTQHGIVPAVGDQKLAKDFDKMINYTLSDYEKRYYIGHMLLNINRLQQTYKSMKYDEEGVIKKDFSLWDYIKKIWDDISDAGGNNHDFKITTDLERPNIVRVVDMRYQESVNLKQEDIIELNIQSNDSIVRDFSFNTSIPSAMSATIAIAAQAPKNVDSLEAASFGAFHQNISNRFATFSEPEEPTGPTEEEIKILELNFDKDMTTYKSGLDDLASHMRDIDSGAFMVAAEGGDTQSSEDVGKHKGLVSAVKRASENLIKMYPSTTTTSTGKKVYKGQPIPKPPTSTTSAIIPLKFNATLDGISGIIIGNVFKLPDSRLPRGYKKANIAFIAMTEDQSITSGQDWTTKITGQMIILPKKGELGKSTGDGWDGVDFNSFDEMANTSKIYRGEDGANGADSQGIKENQLQNDPGMNSVRIGSKVYLKIDDDHTNVRASAIIDNEGWYDWGYDTDDNNIGVFKPGWGGLLLGEIISAKNTGIFVMVPAKEGETDKYYWADADGNPDYDYEPREADEIDNSQWPWYRIKFSKAAAYAFYKGDQWIPGAKIGDKYDKDSADYEHQWKEKYNKHKGWMRLDVLRSYEGTNGSSLISHKKSAKNGEGSYANKWPNGEDGDPIIF